MPKKRNELQAPDSPEAMLAIIERAQSLFQNLRASRETELANEYPLHVVTAWLGNTERVASKHYLQVTDSHFEQPSEPKPALQRVETSAAGISGQSRGLARNKRTVGSYVTSDDHADGWRIGRSTP